MSQNPPQLFKPANSKLFDLLCLSLPMEIPENATVCRAFAMTHLVLHGIVASLYYIIYVPKTNFTLYVNCTGIKENKNTLIFKKQTQKL